MTAASLGGWAIDALIASALLMGAVMLVRAPVRRAFGPQVAYALWALPVLRLLLPPLPAGWWHAATAAPITRAGETITIYVVEPIAAAAPATGLSLGVLVAAVWAAGALAFLSFHLVRHARFCRAIVRSAQLLEERDGVQVIASAAAPGPLAFGLRRRFVAFPRDFDARYDADERALALQHELGHHARRDLHANWAALVVLALHWFSPLAWRAFHAFRADQELANDARVLAGCAPAARHAYGRAIVKAAHGGAVSAACHLHTISDLKGRLRMLTTSRASRRRLATGAAAVTLLVAGGLGLTASSGAAEEIRERLAAPLPALAPVAPIAARATQAEPAPRAATTHRRSHVVVTRDGETRTYDGAEADAYIAENHIEVPAPPSALVSPVAGGPGEPPLPPVPPLVNGRVQRIITRDADGRQVTYNVVTPDVRSITCPGNAGAPVVQERGRDGGERIVICTNRIEAMSARAVQLAADAEGLDHVTRRSARTSLAMARAAVERDRNLTNDQRQLALAGIVQAETELRGGPQD